MRLDLESGRFLVRLARRAIEEYVTKRVRIKPPEDTPPHLREERGVFVTIETYPQRELRGCIGYPEPIKPLHEATIDAAISSATQDPRFPPLSREELDRIVVEVSVLTKPELIDVDDPRELPKHIEIGKHGLIVERGFFRGLLLPQVAVEWNWDAEEFLSNTCIKAGLSPTAWLERGTKVYRFSAQVFSELEPRGDVVELELGKTC